MGKKDEIKTLRKKIQRLKADLADTQARAMADIGRLEDEIQRLEMENQQIRFLFKRTTKEKMFLTSDNDRLKKKLAKLMEAMPPAEPKHGKKIDGWNVVKSGGYYRAFRRIDGKLRAIYLGKNLRGAAQKIRAKEVKQS